MAGKKWLKLFMKRHPELSFRTPQAVSKARASGFTRSNVSSFFDLYEEIIRERRIEPHRVFNIDETGIIVVQHKKSQVLSARGQRKIYAMTQAERGRLITVVACMNATDVYVPPMLVFPRRNMKI